MKQKLTYLLLTFLIIGVRHINAQLAQIDGVYQIETADELIEFAEIVNAGDGHANANAVLTADIDMTGKAWTPIGLDESNKRYCGTFDGQGHIINNLVYDNTGASNIGIFGTATGGCVIKNLIAGPGNSIKCGGRAGGIIGYTCAGNGTVTIENCGNEGSVEASGTGAAAMIGTVYHEQTSTTILNCYNTGNIKASQEAAILSGWFGHNRTVIVRNFFNTGTITGNEGGRPFYRNGDGDGNVTFENVYDLNGLTQTNKTVNSFTSDQLTSGELTYKLNGSSSDNVAWYQIINQDAHPIPIAKSNGIVYVVGNQYCDGANKPGSSYSNTAGTANRDAHNFNDWGFCTNEHDGKTCDEIQPDYIVPINGYYEIANEKQLNWFAVWVNRKQNNIKGKLIADIDFSAYQVTIGQNDQDGKRYSGTFDGQGHTITIGYTNSGTGFANNIALFRYIDGATIQNLKVHGTITTTANQMAGLASVTRGNSKILNVVVDVNMTSSHSGDGTHGGVIAVANNVPILENVAFVGQINATNDYGSCGLIGYAHSGGSITYRNCYVSGTLNLTGDNNRVFGRNGEYAVNSYTTLDMQMLNNTERGGEKIDASTVSSGELAYRLNENVSGGSPWTQHIGTDNYPLPFGTYLVYANGSLSCDGAPASSGTTFANSEGTTTLADHTISDGVCTTCGTWYIETPAQLNAFATQVNNGTVKNTATAYLLNNLDMSEITDYPGIGDSSEGRRFKGKLIGQPHSIISNLKMDFDREDVGLINSAGGGTIVRNITMGANCEIKGRKGVAAFIGSTRGPGNIYIENCGNDGKIYASGANAGGIVGVRYDTNTVYMTNVYNVGEITGVTAGESGSISGWLTNGVLTNCYSVVDYATAEDTHGLAQGQQFARGNNIKLTNCYDYGTGDWGQNNGTWGGPFEISTGHKITDLKTIKDGSLFAIDNPQPATYTNPVYNGDAPDPSVIRAEDGYYYLYSTAEHILRSPDLVNWSYVGQVFGNNPRGTIPTDGEGGVFWAPCITYQNGQYVLYFAVSKTGGESAAWIGVATSDNPEGPFRLVGNDGKMFTSSEIGVNNSIDPYFIEDVGKKYLVWGSFHGIYITELNADGLSVKDKSSKTQLLRDGFEAAYIYKKDGYYYLFASVGSTYGGYSGATYQTVVGRSETLMGTYKDHNGKDMEKYDGILNIGARHYYKVVLDNTSTFHGPGHNSRIVEDKEGKTWMLFHAYQNGSGDRKVCLEELTWNNGWPEVNDNGAVATAQTAPAIAHAGMDVAVWHQGLGDNPHPVLYPGTEFDEDYAFTHKWEVQNDATVYFYRSVVANNWNTLCVPFDLTAAQVAEVFGEGTKVATLRPGDAAYTADNQTMHFVVTDVAEVEAGIPYLIKPGQSITRGGYVTDAIKIAGADVKAVEPGSVEAGSSYRYRGAFDKTTHPVGDLYVATGNMLKPNNVANGVMRGFRTYFEKLDSEAKALFFTIDEEPTGIIGVENGEVKVETFGHGAVYDLQGRKVADNPSSVFSHPSSRKGVYVINGKKVVIK